MSNINPNPRFTPGEGATAAIGAFPYRHQPLSAVDAAVERVRASHRNPVAPPPRAFTDRRGQCRKCKGKSAEWKVGTCPVCGGHGR